MKTVSHPRIHIEHQRAPTPSRAYLYVVVDWLNVLATCEMTEAQLVDLAAEALKVAVTLRNTRTRA